MKYSETSIISDIYTEEKGLRSYIISGVRSKRARVSAGLLQPMSLIDMIAYHREEKDINRIKEIKAAHLYHAVPFDIQRGAVGLFMIELTRKTIRETEEHRQLFQFLFESFCFLDLTEQSVANIHLQFMVELSGFLGFRPVRSRNPQEQPFFDLKEGVFSTEAPDHVYFMRAELGLLMDQFLAASIHSCSSIKMNRNLRKEFLEQLILFYRLQIDNFPQLNAHSILQEIF